MKQVFEIVLNRLIESKLDENILCSNFWRKVLDLEKNYNEADCWSLVIENIEWLINTGTMTTNDLLSWFAEEQLNEHHIYVTGKHEIKNGFAIGIKTAKIESSGHSKIILFDEAQCEAYDSTFVVGFNNSSMELKNCVGDAFNDCKVIAKDFSKVEAWDNTTVKAETYSCIMAHDNVQVENSENTHTVIV